MLIWWEKTYHPLSDFHLKILNVSNPNLIEENDVSTCKFNVKFSNIQI